MTEPNKPAEELRNDTQFRRMPPAIQAWILASPNASDDFATFFAKGGTFDLQKGVQLPYYAPLNPPSIVVNQAGWEALSVPRASSEYAQRHMFGTLAHEIGHDRYNTGNVLFTGSTAEDYVQYRAGLEAQAIFNAFPIFKDLERHPDFKQEFPFNSIGYLSGLELGQIYKQWRSGELDDGAVIDRMTTQVPDRPYTLGGPLQDQDNNQRLTHRDLYLRDYAQYVAPKHAPQASHEGPAALAIPNHLRDFGHEGHPLHASYAEALTAVHVMEDRNKIVHGPHSEQLAAALTVETHQARAYTIRQVNLDGPFAVAAVTMPGKNSYMHEEHTLSLDTRQALACSVEQTSADWSRKAMPHLHAPAPAMPELPTLDLARLSGHDPRHPDHAGHGQYLTLREQVSEVYARHGIPRSEQHIEDATAAVALAARRSGFERADMLWLTPDPRTGMPGPNSGIGVIKNHVDPLLSERGLAPLAELQRAPENNWQQLAQVVEEQMEMQARHEQRRQEEIARGPRGPVMA